MLINTACDHFGIHVVWMAYAACRAEVEFEISLHGMLLLKVKNFLTEWKKDQLPICNHETTRSTHMLKSKVFGD